MTVPELAKAVIALLDLQAEFFRHRDSTKLRECKDAERRLRRNCLDILNPPAAPQPGLFDEGQQ